jgi:hypothetical protein
VRGVDCACSPHEGVHGGIGKLGASRLLVAAGATVKMAESDIVSCEQQ